mgnify:FL=1
MEELNNDTVGFGVKSYDNPMPLNRSYCNGICHKFKSPMPRAGKNPYETHVTCKKCDGIWMKKESCIQGTRIRCPCCNIQVRTTARRKYGGETKKLYESAKQ